MHSLFLWDQTQISILEILSVFLWLKSSSSWILGKIDHFSKVSMDIIFSFVFRVSDFDIRISYLNVEEVCH